MYQMPLAHVRNSYIRLIDDVFKMKVKVLRPQFLCIFIVSLSFSGQKKIDFT